MNSEAPNISENDVSDVFRDFRPYQDKGTHERRIGAVEAISRLVPNTTPQDLETRRFASVEMALHRNRESIIKIPNKEIAEVVDPEYFLLLRELVTGEYKKKLTEPVYVHYARALHAENWAYSLFREDGSLNYSAFETERIIMDSAVLDRIVSSTTDIEQRKKLFVEEILSNSDFWDRWKENIMLTTDEYEKIVSKVLWDEISLRRERDTTPRFSHVNLTYGLELELLPNTLSTELTRQEIAQQINEIDSLQSLGVPIGYDGIRELSLPKSISSRDQLRVIMELVKSGFIKPEQRVAVHINTGGLKLDEKLFLIDLVLIASDIFSYNEHLNRPTVTEDLYKRLLFENSSNDSRRGFPYSCRLHGVVEYRVTPTDAVNWPAFIRGVETFACAVEALAGYQRVQDGSSDQTDLRLAGLWVEFLSNSKDRMKEAVDKRKGSGAFENLKLDRKIEDYRDPVDLDKNRITINFTSYRDRLFRDDMRVLCRHLRVGVRQVCAERETVLA